MEDSKMKILFLDCDGVINNDQPLTAWIEKYGDTKESKEAFSQAYCVHDGFDGYVVPYLVDRVKDVCNKTDCRIVWSSAWRQNYYRRNTDSGEFEFDYHTVKQLWVAKGFPAERLIDCTPCENMSRYSYVPRGVEIQMWLDSKKKFLQVGRCAIFDDDEDAIVGVDDPNVKFFQTSFSLGLTEEIAAEAIEWLNG